MPRTRMSRTRRRLTRMRLTGVLALGLLLTAAGAGCGQAPAGDQVASAGGAPSAAAPGASAAAGREDEDLALKFSQCMRDQGLTWFPDPKPAGGGMQIEIPKGSDKAKVDAAMAACKKWAPGGGERGPADPKMMEQARKLAQCMRDNGVPDFPDPRPDGSVRIDGDKIGLNPGDPAWKKADEACSAYRPDGARHETSKG